MYSVNDLCHQERLAAANRLSCELHEWRASLPPHLGTVKPSTLIPSFRRQAIALQLAYFHALIHTNRPFLLSDTTSEGVSECMSSTKASLELINRMAGDNTLLHSFWWTQYVIFCALAVVYVGEIQRATRSTYVIDDVSSGQIFDLAEKCRSHLEQASAGLSPNQRYSVILDELRSEALRCRNTRNNPRLLQQSSLQGAEPNPNAGFDSSVIQDASLLGSVPDVLLQVDPMSNVLDGFLFSDWQTLDSSVGLALNTEWNDQANISEGFLPLTRS